MPTAPHSKAVIKVFACHMTGSHIIDNQHLTLEHNRSLRHILAHISGLDPQLIEFKRTVAGKPHIASGASCRFSVSHSGAWFAVAVADFEIGIDIETRQPRTDPLLLARRFFHNVDAQRLETAPEPARGADFQRQWVAKEAALKAAGTGIAQHLNLVRCEFDKSDITAVSGPPGRFVIHAFALDDGTPGAVAWHEDIAAAVTLCKWPETAG